MSGASATTARRDAAVPAIGIDLGTTRSAVAVFRDGKVEVIANDQGHRTTPSVVTLTTDAETPRLVGDAALNAATQFPTRTISAVKRLIGRKFDDEALQRDLKHLPYAVVSRDGKPVVRVPAADDDSGGDGAGGNGGSGGSGGAKKAAVDAVELAPEQVSALVLAYLKRQAEAALGVSAVRDAVITVPAYFNNAQRQATKDAGTIAGLNVLRIINEPTAAALAYGLDKTGGGGGGGGGDGAERNVLIYDLGGGTFDVSLLSIEDGVFEVRATAGDTHLGGEDFDNLLVEHLLTRFERAHGAAARGVRESPRALRRLRRAAEAAKRALSSRTVTTVEVDALHNGLDVRERLTRAKFEELVGPLLRATLEPVERVLRDARIDKRAVDDVVLVGGSTRIPKVAALLRDAFNGKEPSRAINPDEAVAHGAAVQAAILTRADRSLDETVLIDVTPLSMSIETAGGIATALVPRGTGVPTSAKQVFSTFADRQPSATIRVFEGERRLTKDNQLLGQFELGPLPPLPRGVPEIEVSFDVDADMIVTVSAVCRSGSGAGSEPVRAHVVIKDAGQRSRDEVDAMVRDAERFKDEDERVAARIDARHQLETLAYAVKAADAADDAARAAAAAALAWLDSDDGAAASTEQLVERRRALDDALKACGGGDGGGGAAEPTVEEVD